MGKQRDVATQCADLRLLREKILVKQETVLELFEEVGSMSVFKRKAASWVDL
jgi:hypothetical protein